MGIGRCRPIHTQGFFRVDGDRHRPLPESLSPRRTTTASRGVRRELSRSSWRRTREAVKRRDGHRCQSCGSKGWIPEHVSRSGRRIPGRYRLVVGHIVPAERYAGHHDDPANLRTLCTSCNNSQRDLDDEQWRVARAARGQTVGQPATAGRTIFDRRPKVW